MHKIRKKTFETNSSSVHTITLNGSCENDLEVNEDGYVHLQVRGYGREGAVYENAEDKLMYAILTVCYTNCIWIPWELCYLEEDEESDELVLVMEEWNNTIAELQENSEFHEIEQCVIKRMSTESRTCNGIKFLPGYGCIDHQSQEYYSLKDFLKSNQISSIEEFIFGKAVLITDSD